MGAWAEFANAEPELAAFAEKRIAGKVVYQATLRLDGAPRVHPVSPWLASGLLCVSFRDTSPKIREVARDARYALHTLLAPLPGCRLIQAAGLPLPIDFFLGTSTGSAGCDSNAGVMIWTSRSLKMS